MAFVADGHSATNVVEKMGTAQQFNHDDPLQVFPIGTGALAGTLGAERLSSVSYLRHGRQGNILLIAGVPISTQGSLDRRLNTAVDSDLNGAVTELSALDGAFAAVFWDEQAKRAAVLTDFVGLQPLYVAHTNEYLLFASDIKGITCSGMVDMEPDLGGWGAFLSFGHLIGERTTIRAVERAKPGTVYIYDANTGRLECSPYWQFPEEQKLTDIRQVDTGAIAEALRYEVQAYLEHTRTTTILLSGGLDSRLLLGALLREQLSPPALIMQHRNEKTNTDFRFAKRVARQFQLSHKTVNPSRSYFDSEHYLDYLALNEVSTPSLYLYIALLCSYLTPAMQAVWEGLVPGPILRPPGGEHGNNFDELLALRTNDLASRTWRAAFHLFRKPVAEEMYNSFLALYKEEASKYPATFYGTSQFMVRNRMRSRTGPNPVKVYGNYVLPFIPGMSRRFFEAGITVPYNLRRDARLYLEVFRREYPALGKVPFNSGSTLYALHPLDIDYQFGKLIMSNGFQRLAAGIKWRVHKIFPPPREGWWWEEARIVDWVIRQIPNDESIWNPDALQALQAGNAPEDFKRPCKSLPFYWQMSKWIFEGRLSTKSSPLRQSLIAAGAGEA